MTLPVIFGRAALDAMGDPFVYADKVVSTVGANLLAYWLMNEASGGTADNYEGTAARDGTYVGTPTLGQPGIGDGLTCVKLNGSTQYIDVFSASLAAAFNGAEGTFFVWCKVDGAGVWTDGEARNAMTFGVNGNNYGYMRKSSTNNLIQWFHGAGGTNKFPSAALSETAWFTYAATWSELASEWKGYINGTEVGSTQTSIGTWVGSIVEDWTNVGALLETPTGPWDGWLAHAFFADTPMSSENLTALSAI